MATCPTFSWGRGSVCHIGKQLYWKRKTLRLLISFDFGHQRQKKKGNAKKAKE